MPQPLASRPTSRSSCAVRVHEARHPGETHGAPHTLPQLACVAVRAARSLPAAGSNLPMIASCASSQPHRARCGGAFLLTLSRTAPLLIHHHPNPVQVSSGVSTKAAAVEPTTSGAKSCQIFKYIYLIQQLIQSIFDGKREREKSQQYYTMC